MPRSSADPWPSRPIGPLHKTDVGGVRLGIGGEAEVTAEATAMRDRIQALGQPLRGFTIQEMAEGVEMLVGSPTTTSSDRSWPVQARRHDPRNCSRTSLFGWRR